MSTPTPRKKNPTTAAKRYVLRGPTGFLRPVHDYSVTVEGHAKPVHQGRNKREAQRSFTTWSNIATGKVVMLFKDSKRINIRL